MKTVIEMAREAHIVPYIVGLANSEYIGRLERFAELVRADERNSWPAEMEAMERQVNILTDALAQAKADEREACAIAAWSTGMDLHMKKYDAREIGFACAATIRSRGETK